MRVRQPVKFEVAATRWASPEATLVYLLVGKNAVP